MGKTINDFNNGYYWLRSPVGNYTDSSGSISYYVHSIYPSGSITSYYSVDARACGVSATITITL